MTQETLENLEQAETEEVIQAPEACEAEETHGTKRKWRRIVVFLLIIVFCVLIGYGIVAVLRFTGVINPYERDYIDITGRTAADVARAKNYKYEKFLKEYGLPADMPKSTSERAVYYNIPVKKYVEKTPGIESFEQLKAEMGWDDTITEETTMGDALDKTKLAYYVGEEQLERFKALYELGDDVTGETLYGEIRNIVDGKEKEFRQTIYKATPEPTSEVEKLTEE